jgi:hypothetical protein
VNVSEPTQEHPRADRLVAWAVFGLALALRLVAAVRLSPHTDEPSTQLAMVRVLETGFPIFRSGILYLQGATVTYLTAILGLLGWSDAWDLPVQRLVTVVPSALGVVLLHRLVRETTGSALAAGVAALLLALDPLAVQWGANVRPYGMLEVLCVVLGILFHRALVRPERRWAVALALVFGVATFTHVGGLMLWPGMAAVVVLLHGRRAWTGAREAVIGLLLSLLGPALMLVINTWFGVTSTRATDRPAFVGNHLVSFNYLLRPTLSGWFRMYGDEPWSPVVPALLLATAVVMVPAVIVRWWTGRSQDVGRLVLLALALAPITAITFMVRDQQARYYLPSQPFLFALVGCAVASWRPGLPQRVVAGTLVTTVLGATGLGLWERLSHPLVDEDYRPAIDWLQAELKPGDYVLAILPPVVELMLPDWKHSVFVAGQAWRSGRYARPGPDGTPVDYWGGWPVLLDERELCLGMLAHPGAWLLLDRERQTKGRTLSGLTRKVIPDATEIAFQEEGAARVLRVLPVDRWSSLARQKCATAIAPVGPIDPRLVSPLHAPLAAPLPPAPPPLPLLR